MSNKVASVNSSKLLDNKLAVILENLNENLKDQSLVEREAILAQFNEVINKFYRTLNNPLFQAEEFREGTFPNYQKLNANFQEVEQDLNIVYKEINSLEKFIVNNFNSLNTQASALRGRLRKVSSDLGDFRLHALDNLGGATYYTDSFQNTEKIDYNSKLYDESANSININSGLVSLPVESGKVKTYTVTETTVGSGSNGISGNNQELNGLLRGELKSITDSNADTWFEYEMVTKEQSTIPLIFEAKFRLDKDSIVNTINLSSMAFAVRNYPRITRLEVSLDGKEYTDILDQIPSSVVFEETDDKVILLNPASGKFSGNTVIKFPPVKTRYINLVFQQDDSYIIKTSSGIKYRKAVGIRDIEIMGEVYEAIGETVSVAFNAEDEIKKVSLISNAQTDDGLTNIKHYISADEGQNWNEIQSVEQIDRDTTEILNFNLEGVDSISTDSPVSSIRHKALLERLAVGFSVRGGVERRREEASEFRTIVAGTQEIVLNERPIASTVNVKNTSFGSVGEGSFHLVNSSDIILRDDFTFVYLPREPFAQNSILEDQEIVHINNELWARTADLSVAAGEAKVYEFDYLNNIIKFGDDVTGKKPDGDIFLGLSREQTQISHDSPRRLQTAFDTDGVKDTTSLYRLEPNQTKTGHVLPKAATISRLNLTDIQGITVTADTAGALASEQIFVNGSTELTATGHYSIDYVSGTIYSYTETAEDSDTVIDITYRPRVDVAFSLVNGQIEIAEEDYITRVESDTLVLAATNVIRLTNEFVEPRSLRFLSLGGDFNTEVPFIGDGSEFDLELTPAELAGHYTVDYKRGIIYTYAAVTGTLVVEYNRTCYYAEYNIAVEVPGDDFTVNEEDNTITFTNKYIIKTFSSSLNRNVLRSLFKVDYSFVSELEQNPRELEKYHTPLLKDYALVVLTKGQL